MPPKRYTIEDCKLFAESKGGKCLSELYINNSTKMEWECSEGHKWWAHWNNIKDSGTWCYYCNGNVKLTLEDCQDYAKENGGKCLSDEYKGIESPMTWECSEGHKWSVAFAGMRYLKQWCPHCSGRLNNNLEVCQEYAKSHGGKCISEDYVNNKTYMNWKCKEGHIWSARFDWMKHDNSWCPYCSGRMNNNLELCKKIAEEYGGKCISEDYVNNKTYMLWECKEGHKWEAPLDSIKNSQTWCPQCSSFRSEKIARETLEELLNTQCPKVRPRWLGGLELDAYCEEDNIALEYHGKQHYEFIPFFHRTETAFEEQKARDLKKKQILAERKIDLLEVPYTYNYTDESALKDYIEREIQFIFARRGELTESEQLHILSIDSEKIEYFDKRIKKKCTISIAKL